MVKRTIKATPPPSLLYDLRAAASAERWARRYEVLAQIGQGYLYAGATAGIIALILVLILH